MSGKTAASKLSLPRPRHAYGLALIHGVAFGMLFVLLALVSSGSLAPLRLAFLAGGAGAFLATIATLLVVAYCEV